MRILGYGEDALTYWALSRRLFDVIHSPRLNDESTEKDSIVSIFRPSFGRAGGSGSAQFGEFDAIIGTPRAVYLVESKWTGEPIFSGQIRLASWQLLRHQIFRWIRDRWQEQPQGNWEQFHTQHARAFADHFKESGKLLAPPGSRLASNLHCILHKLHEYPTPILDVLLFFHLEGAQPPQGVDVPPGIPEFSVVTISYQPLNPDNAGALIDMQV